MVTPHEVRQLAFALPEVTERETIGEITFRVQGRIFITLSSSRQEAGVKTFKEKQKILVAMDPGTFSVNRYMGRFGWVWVKLSSVHRDKMRELIIDAWRLTAPKRLVKSFDASNLDQ